MAIVGGDLDTKDNEDLSNYVWSLGGAYAFTDLFLLNVKMVNGVSDYLSIVGELLELMSHLISVAVTETLKNSPKNDFQIKPQ